MQKKIPNAIFLFILFLTSCGIADSHPSPMPDQMDKSPFTGIPCAAPCWYGLEVGKSNESEVTSTIPILTFIDQNSVYYHRMPSLPSIDPRVWGEGVEITANCLTQKDQCLRVTVVNNILTEIVLKLNYQVNVEEAIQYLGDPKYIGFDRAGGERVACRVYLIWSNKQLVLASKIFDGVNAAEQNCFTIGDTGNVSSTLVISEVEYISAAVINELRLSDASEFFDYSELLP